MHYWPMKETIRCSECGCDRSETVEQGNSRFIRCRGCGHEGCRHQIVMTQKSGKTNLLEKCVEAARTDRTF